MTRWNCRRLFICASLAVVLTAILLFRRYCSNARLWQINTQKETIIGTLSLYLQRPLDNPTGSVVNTSISSKLQQPFYNSELSEINDDVLKQNISISALTSEGEKVAIIVPYRNRTKHLFRFLTRILPFLAKQRKQYIIIVTEQAGNQAFNRAKLFNIAVKEIKKSAPGDRMHGIDCFIFHDVDKVPTSPSTVYECGENVKQLTNAFHSKNRTERLYGGFLGGATALSWKHLEKINGFSNIFFGWGGEDDELAVRLRLNNIRIDRPSKADGIFDEFDANHPRDKNPGRRNLISKDNVTSRWRNDGINQTRYELLSRIDYDVFMWILVSL